MRCVFTKKDGEQWDATDGFPRPVHVLIEPGTVGSVGIAMGMQEIPPGSRTGLHTHRTGEELIFFYQGRGRMQVGDDEMDVGPETAVLIPRGTPHNFVNTGTETVRLTWTFSPAGEHERFRNTERWKPVPAPA